MARKKAVRMSKATQNFICDKIESENLLIEQIYKKYPDKTPNPKTIYRYQAKHPEFEERINHSYNVWLMSKISELEHVSSASLGELFPNLDQKDAYEARRARMDALKFTLSKMAPILSTRWSKTSSAEHKGLEDVGSKIVIMNYYNSETDASKVIEGEVITPVLPPNPED